MALEMIIDAVLALLLAGVIVAAFILDRRLSVVRDGHKEMASLIAQLTAVTDAARAAIFDLKTSSSDSNEELQAAICRASGLSEELTLIVEAGDSLADHLADAACKAGSNARAQQKKLANFTFDGGSEVLMALKEAR